MLYWLFDLSRDWLDDVGLYSVLGILDQIEFRALITAGLAFAIVLALGPRCIRLLVSLKVGDSGETDAPALGSVAKGKANTPTMGGVLIVGAMLISTLLMADLSVRWVQLGLVLVAWLALVGGADDYLKLTASSRGTGRQGLYSWEKLVFQLGIGLIIGFFAFRAGDVESGQSLAHVLNLPFQKTYTTPSLELSPSVFILSMPVFVVLSTLMIAGMSNAVNITDGMDGLASGIGAIIALGALLLALIAGEQAWAQRLLVPYVAGVDELSVLAGAMAGACLGFLWFNCSPAQVFMGDTGSLALGGLLGYLAVATRHEYVVIIMSGVFLLEIGSVIAQVGYFKYTGGKRIFRCAPYHHHLHLGGWTEQQVVARAWITTIVLVVLALALIKVR